jgi:hypothetical protein
MRIVWTISFVIVLISCNTNGKENSLSATAEADTLLPKELVGNFSDQQVIKLDSLSILHFLATHDHFRDFKKDIYRFYRNRNYTMAWFDTTGKIEQASILYNRIIKMKEDGLRTDIPYIEEYSSQMSASESTNKVRVELMQTAQYLHFAKKLLSGIPEDDSKAMEWYIPRKKTDYISLLLKMLEGDTSSINKDIFPQYYLLKKELAIYHQIETNGGWDSIPLSKKKFRYGDSARVIAAAKKRLHATGEYTSNDTSSYFNLALEKAVKYFQVTHGLEPDGMIKTSTVQEMNIPVMERITQIMINMERCRWLSNQTQQSYLLVNIPQFQLYVYNKDSLAFSCKVVVGKETNRTAIFKGDMKQVIFSPYWNVPPNILRKEVLPAIKKNSNYLEENQMEWNGNSVRQLPGPWNALGGVKFVFPNGYDIYLHDTPSKSLFNQSTRTFSHGCIRISEPKKLAMFLLGDQPQWTSEAIDSAMSSRIEKFVTLRKPVPVYVVYFTAFVDADGSLNFRKDVYSRDVQLKKMILN